MNQDFIPLCTIALDKWVIEINSFLHENIDFGYCDIRSASNEWRNKKNINAFRLKFVPCQELFKCYTAAIIFLLEIVADSSSRLSTRDSLNEILSILENNRKCATYMSSFRAG